MPLLNSRTKEDFYKNIKTEIKAGKPAKQAVAIAYSKDIKSKREIDANGFVEIKDNPISKIGVFDYLGSSIDADEKDKIYKVYRSAKELGNTKTIDSFKLIPFVDEHTMLGDRGQPAEEKGVQGTTGEEVYFKDGILYANLRIFSEALKNLIEKGKQELSCGYTCTYIKEDGTFNGEHYDYIQTNIVGNHIALVEEGRMGKDIKVLDSVTFDAKEKLNKENNMENEEVQTPDIAELAKNVKILMDFMAKMKPLEEKEHGENLGKEKSEDEEEKGEKEEKKDDEETEDEEEPKKDDAMDEALLRKTIIKEIYDRDNLAQKLSKRIGTFDHANKTLEEVAQYGLQKLKLEAEAGQEMATLNGYLSAPQAIAMDTKVTQKTTSDEISAYLNEEG